MLSLVPNTQILIAVSTQTEFDANLKYSLKKNIHGNSAHDKNKTKLFNKNNKNPVC